MFFSYPNSTEYNFDAIDYLSNNIDNFILFNISEKGYIDNNIFGYEIYGAKIISICANDLIFKINGTEEILSVNKEVTKDQNIKLELSKDKYDKINCKLEYQIIISESSYEEFNSHVDKIDHFYSQNSEKKLWNTNLYYGKINYYNIIFIDEILTNKCGELCSICYSNDINYCITCKYKTSFEINSSSGEKQKTCSYAQINESEELKTDKITYEDIKTEQNFKINEVTNKNEKTDNNEITNEITNENESYRLKVDEKISEEISEEIKNLMTEENSDVGGESNDKDKEKNFCTNDQILKDICNDVIINNTQIKEIYSTIKNEYILKNKTQEYIIKTKNTKFEITGTTEQKYSEKINISTINLGECENKLKNKYTIPEEESLIIFKLDYIKENLSTTYVQYEIFNPITLEQLDLSICNQVEININVPIFIDEKTESLYQNLNDYGYNLFDSNDSFYNDICTSYSNENNTDMIIEDRRNDFYDIYGNISLCQNNCTFQYYNFTNKKANCKCEIVNQNITENIDENNFSGKKLVINFWKTLKNSNFLVLKCYKVLLNFSNLIYNIGFIIMSTFLILSIIILIIHCITASKKIYYFINLILHNKSLFNKNIKKNEELKNLKKKEKVNNYYKINKSKIKNNINKKVINKNVPPKKSKKDNKFIRNNHIHISAINYKNDITNLNSNSNSINDKANKSSKLLTTFNKVKIFNKKDKIYQNNSKIEKIKKDKIFITEKKFNDYELNTLDYEKALKFDKRTYLQYYWSLLKKKHLILFTFIPNNDYNLVTVKIAIFIMTFTLYFGLHVFFFDENKLHEIYIRNGYLSFLFQIPEILYSTGIGALTILILKQLSLTEIDILSIKKVNNIKKATKKSKKIFKCFKIKISIFFIVYFILILFFWYYISCFCSVYKNAQIFLIKDTIYSFCLSLIYPLGLYLLPGILRISALRAKNKDKRILYKISNFIAII